MLCQFILVPLFWCGTCSIKRWNVLARSVGGSSAEILCSGLDDTQQECDMLGKGRNRTGQGSGGGKGTGQTQRQSGQRGGRNGGPMAAGPEGYCLCTQCGEKLAHDRGTPCVGSICPKCGAPMIRG
jgi:hypothetical protein